jgi:hypothetical protein
MTKAADFSGLGKLVPGFDFLQSLTQGAGASSGKMPSMSNWVAPTLNVEDLEKRISELKTVHFWLDQNTKALAATIQALEVQKMTLATLRGMNVSMGELAQAFKLPEVDMSAKPAAKPTAKAEPAAEPAKKAKPAAKTAADGAAPAAGVVDPMQWWNALGAQFQTIAANTMKDVAAMPEAIQTAGAAAVAKTTKAAAKPAAKKTKKV